MELRTVNGKKQYGYLKKPLKDMLDFIVDELEKMPEVATYYSIWNDLRDTLESYYKSRSGQAQSAFAAERISRDQERHHSGSGASAAADRSGTDSIRAGNFARGRSSFGRNFFGRFYKSDACKRKYFVHSFSFCGTSVRISSEFNHPPVSPDGTNLPRQCCTTQQSDGHPHRLQAPQKAHAEAAGVGA